eukprot:11090987-Alexandrium_andersonii.AAC.1
MLHVPLLAVPWAFAMLCAGMGGLHVPLLALLAVPCAGMGGSLRWAARFGLGGLHMPRRLLRASAVPASTLFRLLALARAWALDL